MKKNTFRIIQSTLLRGITLIAVVITATSSNAQGQRQDRRGPKHVFAGPAPAHPFDVILARPTDRAVTLSVLSYEPTRAFVTYGTSKGEYSKRTNEVELATDTPVEIVLDDLQPDTQYFYSLHTNSATSSSFTANPESSFHTQRRPGSGFVFTIQSDSHLDANTSPAVYERTLANIQADKPDFHIDLGDTFMTGKYDHYEDSLPQYLAQRYYFGKVAQSAPLFLVLGNHDGERLSQYKGTSEGIAVWSNKTRKRLFPNPYPDGFYTGNETTLDHVGRLEDYYAWEWGDALFVALDPFWSTNQRGGGNSDNWSRTLGKQQYDWLAKTLATSKAKFKFVFIHHLVGGIEDWNRGGKEAAELYEWGGKNEAGKEEFAEKRPGWESPIHQLLEKHKVSVVFHGHDHFYAFQHLGDVVYLLVPQPGNPGFSRLRDPSEYGYYRGDFLPPAGHIRVSINGDGAYVEYVRAYIPQNETDERKNGEIGHAFKLETLSASTVAR